MGREWQRLRLTAHNARTNRTETFHKIRGGEIDPRREGREMKIKERCRDAHKRDYEGHE